MGGIVVVVVEREEGWRWEVVVLGVTRGGCGR